MKFSSLLDRSKLSFTVLGLRPETVIKYNDLRSQTVTLLSFEAGPKNINCKFSPQKMFFKKLRDINKNTCFQMQMTKFWKKIEFLVDFIVKTRF